MDDDDLCPLVAETGHPCCLQREHMCPCTDAETIQMRIEEFITMMQECGIKPLVVDQYPDGSIGNARTIDTTTDADELRVALGAKVQP